MEFAGFGDWIEIFRGGKQVDSQGREHDGDGMIDKAVAQFDGSKHEPPLVVGHPVDNSPAFGWVEGVKSSVENGVKVLFAKVKQVVPEFEDLVKKGIYKKRSAAFYPDGSLRHVGFLGGTPPAVKGLADLKFGDDGAVVFEFADREIKNVQQGGSGMDKFKEFVEFLKFWKAEGQGMFQDPAPDKDKKFSEEELKAREEAARKEAEEETRKKVTAEFAEKTGKEAKSRRGEEITAFCDQQLKEGKIVPSWLKLGLKEFMESLDAEETVQFSEGDKGKVSRFEWFKAFMEELPKVVEFKEVAKRGDKTEFAEKEQVEAGHRIAARVNPKK